MSHKQKSYFGARCTHCLEKFPYQCRCLLLQQSTLLILPLLLLLFMSIQFEFFLAMFPFFTSHSQLCTLIFIADVTLSILSGVSFALKLGKQHQTHMWTIHLIYLILKQNPIINNFKICTMIIFHLQTSSSTSQDRDLCRLKFIFFLNISKFLIGFWLNSS